MKKGFWKALALSLVMLTAMTAVAETVEPVSVLPLPEAAEGEFAILTTEEDAGIGPHEDGYLFEAGEKSPYAYADPSITVNLGKGRIYKTNYMYARVKIAFPAQIRVMTSEKNLANVGTVLGSKLASRARAVVAVNGVLEADASSGSDYCFVDGPVMHQGVWKRPNEKTSEAKLAAWKATPALDALVIDNEGRLNILEGETWGEVTAQIEEMGNRAVNVITFGPALIVDGEPRYGYKNRQMSTHRVAQRMAICQTGPLEYLLITSEGPENSGSTGLTLDQFTELVASFPDVKTAYNLDGGSSSTLIFRKGKEFWAKVNANGSKKRALRDIIYFADAWLPAGGAAE